MTARVPGPASSRRTAAPLRCSSSRVMARPRPLPPESRSRASSRRANRSNTRSRSDSGIPCPSSTTRTCTPAPVSRALRMTALVAWRTALSTRFPSARSRSSWRPDGERAARLCPGDPHRDARRGIPSGHVDERLPDVDVLLRSRARVVARPRQHEQVLDEGTQALHLGQQVVGQLPALPEPGRHLELGPHARQRAAQLVCGVGDAARCWSWAAASRASMLLRVVECADLVSGRWHGQPLGTAGPGADPLGTMAQLLDRPQCRADHPPRARPAPRGTAGRTRAGGCARDALAGLEVRRRDGRHREYALVPTARADPGHDEVPRQPGPAAGTVTEPPATRRSTWGSPAG